MKKIIVLIASFLLVLGACSSNKTTSEIKAQDVLDKMENKETFVVYLGTTTCSACIAYKPVVKEMMKNYDVTIYSVMLDNESDEAIKTALLEAMPIQYTPATQLIVDGEVVKSYEGLLEYTELKKMLVEYAFLQ